MYPALEPSGHLRFVKGNGEIPTLGPRNTRLRQIKNTGDFDVTVNFNKYGFRDSKNLEDSAPGDYFLVGDSLSIGWGVEEEERYSNLIQAALGRKVFNLSIPGDMDNFEKVLGYAKKNGAKITRLLLAISMSINLKNFEKKAEEKPAPSPRSGIVATLKPILMTHSAFYFLVTSFVHKNEMLKKKAIELGFLNPSIEGVAHLPFSRENINSMTRRAARLAEKYETTIIIGHSRGLWFGTEDEKKTAWRTHKAVIAQFKKIGLKVIDIGQAFSEDDDPQKNYFANDGHWSPKGHASAARAIIKHLKAKN
ncbi:MAG: hypothetical protein HQ494_06885 [Rhodospirillales bacterium]|nr:hypothetical protein [Rhodospirillales bacterium]